MKLAVINFSGNVGKTTVARHLLLPRIPGAQLVTIESVNADADQVDALTGKQFAALQDILQTRDDVVVDIGASNVEDLLNLMRRYRGSEQDFDFFIVPTVSARKQQLDTIKTLSELSRTVEAGKLRVVFNQVDDVRAIPTDFGPLLQFLAGMTDQAIDTDCCLGSNEVYQQVTLSGASLAELAEDSTDYKARIATATDSGQKLAMARQLATRRLACGVLPELDACFRALRLS